MQERRHEVRGCASMDSGQKKSRVLQDSRGVDTYILRVDLLSAEKERAKLV